VFVLYWFVIDSAVRTLILVIGVLDSSEGHNASITRAQHLHQDIGDGRNDHESREMVKKDTSKHVPSSSIFLTPSL